MNCNQEYLVKLISSAIFKTETPLPGDDVDWDLLLNKCAEQNITGLAASAILRLPDENKPGNFVFWFNSYIETLQMMSVRNAEFDRMIALFHANGIDPIGVKGSVLRKLYPDEALRTMGDCDIWILSGDIQRIKEILEEHGYSVIERPLHLNAQKGDAHFEIFTSLEQDFKDSHVVWEKLILENVCRRDDGMLILAPTYNLFYLVLHTSKHYLSRGSGIRSILDIVLLLKNYGTDIDYALVLKYCEEAHIEKIFEYILSTAKMYFNIDTPITKEIPKTEMFFEYMLEYGVFGPDIEGRLFLWYVIKNKKYGVMRFFFPPYDAMKGNYRFLKRSKILLPVAWICRGFNAIFRKNHTPASIISDMKASEDFGKIRMNYLKELGLWNE